MLKDETDDILAALDATHSRLAQQVAGSAFDRARNGFAAGASMRLRF